MAVAKVQMYAKSPSPQSFRHGPQPGPGVSSVVVEEHGPLIANGENRAAPPHPQRFLARQPILNHRQEVFGYELLFRTGWENCFRGEREQATRETLDSYLYMGIESLANDGLAFVNCTREALIGGWVTLLPPKTTVLEIMETVEPDADLVEACIALRKMGYLLALDDFVPRPEMQPLVEIASYVKVDIRHSNAEMRRKIHGSMRASRAALLAEKVEDQEDLNIAISEGYQYFQGYFFCRPTIMTNREIPANRMNYLRLLIGLDPDPAEPSGGLSHCETGDVADLPPAAIGQLRALEQACRRHQRAGCVHAGGRGPLPCHGVGGRLVCADPAPAPCADQPLAGTRALLRIAGPAGGGESQ